MKRLSIFISIAVVIGTAALYALIFNSPAAAQRPINIPKSWGSVKGMAGGNYLALEAPDGTIRIVQFMDGSVLTTAIRN